MGYENGLLYLWDTRYLNTPYQIIDDFGGVLISAEFHPTAPGVIACGFFEKMVKVWLAMVVEFL